MSDDRGHGDDAFDDRIRRSMGSLGAGAAQAARASTGAEIRHRATRRRQALAAGTLTAALIIGGGAVAASNVLDRTGVGTIVVPADPPSATTPATPGPAPTPTEPPTPTPDEPTSTPPPTSETPRANPVPTEIPASFTLPHEGEASQFPPDVSDWETVGELTTPWDMTVCGVDLFDGDEARTDFRKVSQNGPEFYDSHSLAVYDDAEVAVGVMASMRAAIDGCVDEPILDGKTISFELRAVDAGGEAFVAVAIVTNADGIEEIGGGHWAVARLGTAIYLTTFGGESFPSIDDGTTSMLEQQLRDFVPQLCAFTVAGC